jgi:alpha-galactosidase
MKLNVFLVFSLIAIFGASPLATAQTTQTTEVPESVDKWITTTFRKGKIPPFSFLYNGVHSREFINKWSYSLIKNDDQNGIVDYTVSYLDAATGLKVDCHIKGFREFSAVEWVLNFTNTSSENTPQITQVKTVDYSVISRKNGNFNLLHASGSNQSRADFHPIIKSVTDSSPVCMTPTHGRSSDTSAFPFFNVISPDNTGFVVAIGWTGTWYSDLTVPDLNTLNLAAGMKHMNLHLYPGEIIRTPLVAMLFWEGQDYMVGNNAFRRFVLKHHTHKATEHYSGYSPLCAGLDWGDPAPCQEYGCLTEEYAVALIKRYKMFGLHPEVIWLDAGWYEGRGGPNGVWWQAVGSWVPDKERFPSGLKPLSDAAHSIGAKLMVWFEPERAYDNSILSQEHPDWLLKVDVPYNHAGNNLLDLGNKDAFAWLCEYIGDLIMENQIDYYRQDFNMPIDCYWEKYDDPNRIGIKEIRHIEGLYAYWDYLLKRFPDLMIDNCASGGRRIDLETISRSTPLWRSDYQYGESNGAQCHTYALSFFLPLHGTGVYSIDNYDFRSGMSSALLCNWEITSQRVTIAGMQNLMDQFRELRPYYMEDYYPLTGLQDNSPDTIWLAYQFHRQSDNTGIIMAFRRKDSQEKEIQVRLRGLQHDVRYEVTNVDTGEVLIQTGSELMSSLSLILEEPQSSLLMKYKLIK